MAVLVVLLAGVGLANVGIGAFGIPPAQVVGILLERAQVASPVEYTAQQEAVLMAIRLPRAVLALLVGAALGVSGAVYQGIFRNPLASPSLLGVSGGAAAAASVAIVLGLHELGPQMLGTWMLPLAAFAGALATSLGIYRFARRGGRTEVTTLLLAGIAVTALMSAIVALMTYLADDSELRSIVFWQLGSVSGATWSMVTAVAALVTIGVAMLMRQRRTLNLLALGDAEARHLGVHTEATRLQCVILAALATGAVTAVAGIVAFVGLVAPHLMRLIVGPDHRVLLPASALGGAALVASADLIARTAVSPAQLPLGPLTALIGGPYFLYLIERTRREHGGWL